MREMTYEEYDFLMFIYNRVLQATQDAEWQKEFQKWKKEREKEGKK